MKKILLVLALLLSLMTLSACQKSANTSSESKEKPSSTVNKELYRNFYEIFTGSFSDSNGDKVGDLTGISQKLDYLNTGDQNSTSDLKVQGICLTPIFQTTTYHGYDVVDYEKINSKFGTMTDFENLIARAKKRGLAVILDMPFNHTSTEHQWFKRALAGDEKYVNYYNWSETATEGYNLASNGKYYESNFDKSMPDLNLDNPDVKDEISKITKYWLDKGVSGFRLDAVGFYFGKSVNEKTIQFTKWLMETVKKQNENAYLVGEDYAGGTEIESLYPSGIDSLFNFPMAVQKQDSLLNMALLYEDGASFAELTASWDSQIHQANKNAIDAPFLTNHDMDRAVNFVSDLDSQKMAASAYLLLPGNPFIYYGEEIGMTGSGIDQNKRLPMMWTKEGKNSPKAHEGATETAKAENGSVEEQEKNSDSLLNWYKKVLRIKLKYPELPASPLKAISTGQSSLAVLNYGLDLTVIHNFSAKETVKMKIPEELKNRKILDGLYIKGEQAEIKDNQMTIPSYSTVILRK